MRDDECVALLQWALPALRMRWEGFRKVRGQVCKRIQRRLASLGLDGAAEYRTYLSENPAEQGVLDGLCRVSISRFYRDRQVFVYLGEVVLPALAQRAHADREESIKIWSAGCGAGEEPYTVSLLWHLQLQSKFPGLGLEILASDASPNMIRRAEAAVYHYATIKNLPEAWRHAAFIRHGDVFSLKSSYRKNIRFIVADIRQHTPEYGFDLILCRNLVFTYFDDALQRDLLERIVGRLKEGGALIIGVRETLPAGSAIVEAWSKRLGVYQKPLSQEESSVLDH